VSKERWFRAQLSEKDYWADASRAGDDNEFCGAAQICDKYTLRR
jgi:hypothetical protein